MPRTGLHSLAVLCIVCLCFHLFLPGTSTDINSPDRNDRNGIRPLFTYSNAFVSPAVKSRVVSETYDFSGESGGPSYYHYDGRGFLARKVFVRSDGLRTETTYQYADDGVLRTSERKFRDGKVTVFRYEYNQRRQLVSRRFQRSDGLSGSEEYTYDEHGRLVGAEYRNMDSWLTGTLTFTHDGQGRLAAGRFKGKTGFDAEISFGHSTTGQLIRIHWIFSMGKTQTYTFEYAPIPVGP